MTGMTAWLVAGVPLLVLCGLVFGGLGGLLGGYLYFSKDLPKIPDLRKYRPKTVSTFYASDGSVIGIFYREKRFPVSLGSIPRHTVDAFLAAEDVRFFSHPGVDWLGVLRAGISNLQMGRLGHGGSTITQQVTRNFLLTRKKSIKRKIREAILSVRLEQTLSKKEILELYLNEIYLGSGAYGVESAARTYFGKSCGELSIAESAMLAGLVPSPAKYSPTRNMEMAMKKRNAVLESMLKYRFITSDQYEQAIKEAPKLRENLPSPYERAPFFTEAVRQYVLQKYGEEKLYNDGLTVYTTVDPTLQANAQRALRSGIFDWEKRQRRPSGLIERLSSAETKEFLNGKAPASYEEGDVVRAVVVENKTPKPKRKRKKKKDVDLKQEVELAMPGNIRFTMELESEVRYRARDLLEFKITGVNGKSFSLEQQKLPPIEGAVVTVENHTGYVRALVGGLDFRRSKFNRAVQARRQAGSSFKPFVYAAALEWGDYSPFSRIVDEPIAVVIDPKEPEWTPMNSDGKFAGTLDLRTALIYSRNTAAVKLAMDLGIDSTIKMARNLGVESPLGRNLSLSLGAAEVTPLEMTSAYTVFPNMGMRVQPVLVTKVIDRFGNLLEDNTCDPLVINPDTLSTEAATAWLKSRTPAPPTNYGGQFYWQNQPAGPQSQNNWWDDNRFNDQSDDFERTPPVGPAAGRAAYNRQPMAADPRFQSPGIREEIIEPDTDPTLPEAPFGYSLESLLSGLRKSSTEVERRPPPKRALSPQTAYLIDSILRDTCVRGTAAKASRMKRRDIAGKTGTTDDCTDAWFIGFNPSYTTGVWIGYDEKVSLGKKEYGNRAALPVWMEVMGSLLDNKPNEEYVPPPGLAFYPADGQVAPNRAALLEAGPDLDHNVYLFKPYTRMDAESGMTDLSQQWPGGQFGPGMPGSFQQQPYGPYSMQAMDSSGYPGSIRVLNERGDTLGYAPYSVGEKGQTIVHREYLDPYRNSTLEDRQDPRENDTERAEAPADPRSGQQFLPRAARFFRQLGEFFQSQQPGGWVR